MLRHAQHPKMPQAEEALPGRDTPLRVTPTHFVNQNPIVEPFPENMQIAMFGLGCFWGAERKFWQMETVFSTMVGYSAGFTPNPSYQEVCTGMTGHNEVVRIIYDPSHISFEQLLITFWQSHDPTQGYRQGNDIGTQYRSGIYFYDTSQQQQAQQTRDKYQAQLSAQGLNKITTEIVPASEFYYAEDYHQQYLAKNPNGYCGLGGLNIAFRP